MKDNLDTPDLVERLKADMVAMYKPVNSHELFAIERVAHAQQALRRCAILETKLFEASLNPPDDADGEDTAPTLPFTDPRHIKAWQTFLRYQAQTERLYRRALADLDRILALREEVSEPEELDVPQAATLAMPFPALSQPSPGRSQSFSAPARSAPRSLSA